MAFFVDDEFSNSKEVLAIPRRHRLAAVGLWTLAGSWSANKLTDGEVPGEVLKELGATPAVVAALVDSAGLWERHASGIRFLNWAKWQRTRDAVKAYRQREREKKQNQRNGRKTTPEPETTSGNTKVSPRDTNGDEKSCPPGNPDIPIPVPIPITNNPLVTLGVSAQSVPAGSAHTPSKFCPKHPNGTSERCGDCANARTAFTAWQAAQPAPGAITAAESATQARRQAIKAAIAECPDCDPNGLTYAPDDPDTLIRCTHKPRPEPGQGNPLAKENP